MRNKMKRGGHTVSFSHSTAEAKDNRKFFSREVRPILNGYVPAYGTKRKKKRRVNLLQFIARKISRPTY